MVLWSRFLAFVRVSYILNLLKSDGKSRCNVFLLVLLAKKNYNMIFHHFSRGIGNNHWGICNQSFCHEILSTLNIENFNLFLPNFITIIIFSLQSYRWAKNKSKTSTKLHQTYSAMPRKIANQINFPGDFSVISRYFNILTISIFSVSIFVLIFLLKNAHSEASITFMSKCTNAFLRRLEFFIRSRVPIYSLNRVTHFKEIFFQQVLQVVLS